MKAGEAPVILIKASAEESISVSHIWSQGTHVQRPASRLVLSDNHWFSLGIGIGKGCTYVGQKRELSGLYVPMCATRLGDLDCKHI